MNVKEIITKYLKDNNFDGLCRDDCDCEIDDLMTCNDSADCEPGYKKYCKDCKGCYSEEFFGTEWCIKK